MSDQESERETALNMAVFAGAFLVIMCIIKYVTGG